MGKVEQESALSLMDITHRLPINDIFFFFLINVAMSV